MTFLKRPLTAGPQGPAGPAGPAGGGGPATTPRSETVVLPAAGPSFVQTTVPLGVGSGSPMNFAFDYFKVRATRSGGPLTDAQVEQLTVFFNGSSLGIQNLIRFVPLQPGAPQFTLVSNGAEYEQNTQQRSANPASLDSAKGVYFANLVVSLGRNFSDPSPTDVTVVIDYVVRLYEAQDNAAIPAGPYSE